ncbi:multiple organellar RNA editing factor 8, chloroplastic/mitochondrial-like [Phoenix dactylifera]|uniref:Multiple organellar RNA editing factor 8, chloroplastic/mitochondrial-like n=1 Tax=Phoenix dactylifera TaxID=42345 RepID=A0A8B7CE44_PHODC|nr:multiple organellar RNA editing factor 8, chloroplastic/mitochondrial-like [Phoenix dactylifera]
MAGRALISKFPSVSLSPLLSSGFFASRALFFARPSSPLLRLRPLLPLADYFRLPVDGGRGGVVRCFSTRPTTSSLNDPSPNWSNRPPKETILLDGCDFEHWLIVMEPPDPSLTRDEIIDSYIKTLAQVLGSEEEAKQSIYSVSTKHYFAFGCKVSEETSYKIKPLPKVRWVLPDSYLDVKNKDYGGEPFIDGKAVPYDPKYHEEWVRNNARANERSRRNDRPRNFDRSRNFERRRENMQNFQNREAPPMPNQSFQSQGGQNPFPPQSGMPPRDMPPMPNAQNAMPPRQMPPPPNRDYNAMPPNVGGMPHNYQSQMPPNPQSSYAPNSGPGYQGSQGYQGGSPGGGMPSGPGYQGGVHGYQGGSPGGGMPGAPGYQGGGPGYQGGNPGYQGGGPGYQGGSPPYQGGGPGYQQDGPPYQGGSPNYQQGGRTYQGDAPAYQGRDLPGRDHQ